MPRKDFFGELRTRYMSDECKRQAHDDCPLEVILGDPSDYPAKRKPCGCVCHVEPYLGNVIRRLKKKSPQKQ